MRIIFHFYLEIKICQLSNFANGFFISSSNSVLVTLENNSKNHTPKHRVTCAKQTITRINSCMFCHIVFQLNWDNLNFSPRS